MQARLSLCLGLALTALPLASASAQSGPTLKILASFTNFNRIPGNSAEGDDPNGVIFDSSGNLFGVTTYGRNDVRGSDSGVGGGTLFEISRGSTGDYQPMKTLDVFTGDNGAAATGALTFDTGGNLYGATEQGGANNLGTVYEVAKGTTSIKTLVSFDGAGAAVPLTGVLVDGSGNLYGSAARSGPGSGGTYGAIYEIAAGSHAATNMVAFNTANGLDATSLFFDRSGNIIGTASDGYPGYAGTVFEFVKQSAGVYAPFSTIATLPKANGGYPSGQSPSGVTFDRQGNLFGVARNGGASGVGTIFAIAKGSDHVTTVASFSSDNTVVPNGYSPGGALTLDSAGNFFGVTRSGGAFGAGTVFELAAGSTAIQTIYSFDSLVAAEPNSSLIIDAAGNIFGTTINGGNGGGTVYELFGAASPAAVPEASTTVSLGLLLMLGVGGIAFAARRKSAV